MNLTHYNIILGSESKRREKILQDMGLKFKLKKSKIKETYPSNLRTHEISEYLAKIKSDDLQNVIKGEDDLLITADTIVIHNNKVLKKPRNIKEAIKTLESLSGETHTVITSVCLSSLIKQETFSETTYVTFNQIDQDIIEYYIRKYQPFDKAGSYGIQEWIGIIGIKKINGSYTNVVGLPSGKLVQKIRSF